MYLLDVNVLIALLDPNHINHETAHYWFERNAATGWATCPTVINGCVRILSSPAYPTVEATASEIAAILRQVCASNDHSFWMDELSLLDEKVFEISKLAGHRSITDAYLLAIAVKHKAALVSFDRKLPVNAVIGATAASVQLLGGEMEP